MTSHQAMQRCLKATPQPPQPPPGPRHIRHAKLRCQQLHRQAVLAAAAYGTAWPSQRQHHARTCHCRAVARSAAAISSAAVHVQEPQYLADLLLQGVALPVLGAWLFVTLLSALASRARQWCEEHPDEPLSMELLGLLPAALESPTRLALLLFVTTRVLRNLAVGIHGYVQAFKPNWNQTAASWAQGIIGWLGPFDETLLKLYTVVAVFAAARVLIKWKSIALEFVLHQRAANGAAASATPAGGSSGGKGRGRGLIGSTGKTAAGGGGAFRGAAAATVAAAGLGGGGAAAEDDDFDEAGVMAREGSMLSVTMRPRSSSAQAAPANERGGASALATSMTDTGGVVVPAPAVGWAGSGGGSSGVGSRDDGAVERLLLPLDSVLSWAIAVSAALFVVQTLGINIQPLLAVGGASSVLIAIGTQTLLTNTVMGLSLLVARPFVPGDHVTLQAAGAILVSGVVERVTPMRTLLRTDDDVLVTLPNKTIADMIVYNKSRREARSRLVARSWERPFLKFKVKLPQKELSNLQELQRELKLALKRPGVAQQSIEVALSKFTDAGAEVLLQCLLLVAVGSPTAQQLLLDLVVVVRKHGATLVSIL